MKKLLSLALITSLLVGSTPMHAGNILKKTWAYTKIALGVGNLAAAVYLPFHALGRKVELKKEINEERSSNYYQNKLRNPDGNLSVDFNGSLKDAAPQADQIAQGKFDKGINKGKQLGQLRPLVV